MRSSPASSRQPERRPRYLYSPLEQGFLEVLETGYPAGFDASDQMPAEVGSGAFWREATALVNGEMDPQAAADAIERVLADLS